MSIYTANWSTGRLEVAEFPDGHQICHRGPSATMSDQEFETSREFVILDFLSSLKTPMFQNLPNHFQVLFEYNCQVFLKGGLLE